MPSPLPTKFLINQDFKFKILVNAEDKTFTLPFIDQSPGYNCVVNWGDTTTDTITAYNDEEIAHTYTNAGTYIISIIGVCSAFYFSGGFEALKLIEIISWGDVHLKLLKLAHAYNLISLPKNEYGRLREVTSFAATFSHCYGLIELPDGLLANNHIATNFSYCFDDCNLLTTLPKHLFNGCISGVDFNHCFLDCAELLMVPEELFKSSPLALDFNNCFASCTSLTAIPAELFLYNTIVEDFWSCFDSDSALTGNAPTLWLRDPEPDGSGCFYGCTNLANYATIPTAWK